MKRLFFAVTVGLIVTVAIAASAASLGGLTSTSLGANDTVVAACDTDGVSIDYVTTYNATSRSYDVSSIDVAALDLACAGQQIKVSLANATTSLVEVTGVVAAPSTTLAVPTSVSAENVARASVVID